jgi:hypothetical protein
MHKKGADVSQITGFEPWVKGWVPQYALIKLNLSSYQPGLLLFALYWGIPFFICAFQGTLVTPEDANWLKNSWAPLNLHWGPIDNIFDGISSHQQLTGHKAIAYLNDTTHFLFSAIISLGAVVGVYLVRILQKSVQTLYEDGVPNAKPADIHALYENYRAKAYGRRGTMLALCLAALTTAAFALFSDSPAANFWWGFSGYGYAGFIFAILIGIAVYWGTRAFFILGFGSLMIARLLERPVTIRPFHADGCSGFAPVGEIIILLWLYALLVALAIVVVMRQGYLGIENTPVAWSIVLIAIGFLPALAIVPLLKARKALLVARSSIVASLEPRLMRYLAGTEEGRNAKTGGDMQAKSDSDKNLEKLLDAYASANIWPFNRQVTVTIFVANILQFIVLAKTIIGAAR